MDVLELDHPSLDNPFIPIDFDESQRYKSMIIYDIHVRIQDTSYGSIMIITCYTSAQFFIVVHYTIMYLFLKSNIQCPMCC